MGEHRKGGQRNAGNSGYRGAHSGKGGSHGGSKDGCAVAALALAGGFVSVVGALGYAAVELASRVIS